VRHLVGCLLLTCFAALALPACRTTQASGPYEPASEDTRRTVEAERLCKQAADLIGVEPAEAERLLREALSKDLFFGPAHNNLGVLFLEQGKLYEAASEFEWARKLMPGHPDPRVNLALTLERAGKTDDAIATYGAALQVYPDYLPAVQGIACLTLRSGRSDERLHGWLQDIAIQSPPGPWRDWGQRHLAAAR
jgi:Flp pilus assembly protein TadD